MFRRIADNYYVSPQIEAGDIAALAAEGFTCIICNRPDTEVPPSQRAAVIEQAARAYGLGFVENPLTFKTMTAEPLALQRRTADKERKVLAYCASGMRSVAAWVLSHSDSMECEALLAAATGAGYDLAALRPMLMAREKAAKAGPDLRS